MNVWGFILLAFVAVAATFFVLRITKSGPESGLPRCATCRTYEGCACDRPKTGAPAEPAEESDDV